jgi:hypothetical protein
MDFRIRLFLDTIIDTVNQFNDIPLEARRLVLESAMHIVKKAADKAKATERESMEEENAESVLKDQLGELPERTDTDK